LSTNDDQFRLLVESVRDYAIFMLDPTGRVATWNVGAQRIKGYEAHEIIGRHFSAFYPPEEATSGKCEYELQMAAADGRFEDEGWRVRKDGTRFWANVVISAVRNAAGELVGFSKVTRDLTERRAAEEARAAGLAAEQANRAKDEFLAMLGHELRNPMAPIFTALQLLKLRSGGGSREQDIIERQVMHMARLIDDLLDVSRITRGKIDLERQRVDLRSAVAAAVEVASPLLEQRAHHLEIAAPTHPLYVDGDEARLTQVFSNLMTNAAKYTEPGGRIVVRLGVESGKALVEVRDNGVGIDAGLLPRVFDLFVQGYQSADRSHGGLGLGLSLVRALVVAHQGTVEAHSPGLGAGSSFTVRLPISEAAAPLSNPGASGSLRVQQVVHPRKVLLVDDNDDARELLVDALRAIGHDVRGAADPLDALDVVKAFRPEVAVLDIGLPVMDGYELATRLRAVLPAPAPRMIALTGYGQLQDHARSAEAGFDVHLVKPIDVRRLADAIASVDVPP
jgi:PAS domain S-box-containing protein